MNTNEILPVKEEIPHAELNVNDILPLPVKVEEIPLEILKPQAELIDINKIVKDRQKELISHAKPSEIIMEYVGRICYDSWEKRTADSVQPFLITAAKKGHRTIFEFNQLFFSVKLPMAARKPILKTQHYKYLNVCNVYDNGVIAMTGSLRAFIELLESYLIDEDQSPILFKSLYMEINQKYDYLFDNWPTAIGLKQLNNLINEIPDYKNMVIFDDVTSDYKNPNKNTKILSHITCGREMSLQIVRHRPVSYQQSSQRYVRFNKENPYSICVGDHLITNKRLDFKKFVNEMHKAFIYYTELLKDLKPEDARVALPNCTTTRLFMYATKDEYRHIFSLRQAKDAYHPIRQIFNQLYNQLINDRII